MSEESRMVLGSSTQVALGRDSPPSTTGPVGEGSLVPWVGLVAIWLAFLPIQLETPTVTIRPFDIWILGISFVAFSSIALSGRLRLPTTRWKLAAWGVLIAGVGTTNLLNERPGVAIRELLQGLELFILLLVLTRLNRGIVARSRFFFALGIGFLVLAAVNAGWHWSQGVAVGHRDLGPMRLCAGLAAALLGAKLLSDDDRPLLTSAFFISALFLTVVGGDRKAWVGLVVAVILGGVARSIRTTPRSGGRSRGLVLAALLGGLFGAGVIATGSLPGGDALINQARSLGDLRRVSELTGSFDGGGAYLSSSNQARLVLLRYAVTVTTRNPLTGVGSGEFEELADDYFVSDRLGLGVHNEYLRYAAENGVIVALLHLGLWLLLLLLAWRMRARDNAASLALISYLFVVNAFLSGGVINALFLVFGLSVVGTGDPDDAFGGR